MRPRRIGWSIVGLMSLSSATRASHSTAVARHKRSTWQLVVTCALAFFALTDHALGGACRLQELLPVRLSPSKLLGWSLHMDGDQAIIGDPLNGKYIGAAYIFRFDDNDTPLDPTDDRWDEQAILVPSNGEHSTNFGSAVAIHGDWAVVGAPDAGTAGAPYVYVFRRHREPTQLPSADDAWVEHGTLSAIGLSPFDRFGTSVLIHDDWIVVGVYTDDGVCPEDRNCNSGAAYVFRRDDNGTPSDLTDDLWIQHAKLTASDAARGDHFGSSVSISGQRLLVGAAVHGLFGAVYVFRRDENGTPQDPSDDSWVEEGQLVPSQGADQIGSSVSLSGDRALVGDRLAKNEADVYTGAAYVFRYDDAGTPLDPTDDQWVEEDKLTASDGVAFDYFGTAVSLSGERAVIGATGDDDLGSEAGSAYAFRRSDNGTPTDFSDDCWIQTAKLLPTVGEAEDKFGFSVGVGDDRALVGAPAFDVTGMVHAFSLVQGCADLAAFATFQSCFSGEENVLPGCEAWDLHPDNRVDLNDFAQFMVTFTGP